MASKRSPYVYFTRLSLTNIKSFGETQELDLRDPRSNRPARWTLILGDNGVGKTTLLQCIALMRPFLATLPGTKSDSPEPDHVQPALAQRDDSELAALARVSVSKGVRLEADLVRGQRIEGAGGRPTPLRLWAEIGVKSSKLDQFEPSDEQIPGFTEPLVIGYSAARHMSYRRGDAEPLSDDPTVSLFDPSVELADAEDVLQRLDYASYKKNLKAEALLGRLKQALARLLPDVANGDDILIYGPPTPADEGAKSGVHVITPYGEVSLTALSLGYQTVAGWALDLAWRLFEHYPEAEDPLQQPAIVLIDEIDLHLHPLWQRQIRGSISEFFPHVQFVATAHSPLMVQSYFDSNVVVLTRNGSHVEIENDPAIVSSWGLDEVVTSDLFGLTSAYAPPIDALIRDRAKLLGLARRSAAQMAKLEDLQSKIEGLTGEADIRGRSTPGIPAAEPA